MDAYRSVPPFSSSEGLRPMWSVLGRFRSKPTDALGANQHTFAYLTVHVEAHHPKHLHAVGIHSIMRKQSQARGAKRPSWSYYGEYGSFSLEEYAKAEACMTWLKRPSVLGLHIKRNEYAL